MVWPPLLPSSYRKAICAGPGQHMTIINCTPDTTARQQFVNPEYLSKINIGKGQKLEEQFQHVKNLLRNIQERASAGSTKKLQQLKIIYLRLTPTKAKKKKACHNTEQQYKIKFTINKLLCKNNRAKNNTTY